MRRSHRLLNRAVHAALRWVDRAGEVVPGTALARPVRELRRGQLHRLPAGHPPQRPVDPRRPRRPGGQAGHAGGRVRRRRPQPPRAGAGHRRRLRPRRADHHHRAPVRRARRLGVHRPVGLHHRRQPRLPGPRDADRQAVRRSPPGRHRLGHLDRPRRRDPPRHPDRPQRRGRRRRGGARRDRGPRRRGRQPGPRRTPPRAGARLGRHRAATCGRCSASCPSRSTSRSRRPRPAERPPGLRLRISSGRRTPRAARASPRA